MGAPPFSRNLTRKETCLRYADRARQTWALSYDRCHGMPWPMTAGGFSIDHASSQGRASASKCRPNVKGYHLAGLIRLQPAYLGHELARSQVGVRRNPDERSAVAAYERNPGRSTSSHRKLCVSALYRSTCWGLPRRSCLLMVVGRLASGIASFFSFSQRFFNCSPDLAKTFVLK